jgi:hypothetical protein
MPGAYAHLTLVEFASELPRIQPRLSPESQSALLKHKKYAQLGAVSPDYPYLGFGDPGAGDWADAMHHDHTLRLLRSGVDNLRTLAGAAREKGLAWLLGYSSHMAADVTIHPVVSLKVGPYKGNEKAHRICEFHQDAYIWQRMRLSGVGVAKYLDSGIGACSHPNDHEALDPDIAGLWRDMLEQTYPQMYKQHRPNPDAWHDGFHHMAADLASNGYRMASFIRNLAVAAGLTYPEKADPTYINVLEVPDGAPQGYDAIFDNAIENAVSTWELVDRAVTTGSPLLADVDTWDLDSGRREGPLVFWG